MKVRQLNALIYALYLSFIWSEVLVTLLGL